MRYLSLFSGIEAATVACKGMNWQAVAFSEIADFPSAVLKYHYPDVLNLGDVKKQDFMENVLGWQGSLLEFCLKQNQDGFYGKMSPEFCQQMAGTTLKRCSLNLKNSGMVWHGEFWTHNISEFPKDAVESSLSDILETGAHLSQFYLSKKACQGILRRAKENNVTLPGILEQVLSRQC